MIDYYLQFANATLPVNFEVDSVFFGVTHFAHTSSCLGNCNADFYFYRITEPWSEDSITWNHAPAVDPVTFYGPITIAFPNDFGLQEYNITEMFKSWENGTYPNFGFKIYSPTLGCNNVCVSFYAASSDNPVDSIRPYMKIKGRLNSSVPSELDRTEFTVYPNPSSGKFQISFSSEGKVPFSSVNVYNTIGEKIYSTQIYASKTEIDLSKYPKGIYFFQLIGDNQNSKTGKIIIFP